MSQGREDLRDTNRFTRIRPISGSGVVRRGAAIGKLSVGCQICNVFGRSCCSVQPLPPFVCAPSHQASPSSTRKATTKA